MIKYDLIIVGSGFGGSLLAMIARKIGLSVLLLERGSHPRFAIGESTSPLANLIIEQLAEKYDLPRLRPLTSYGSWQREHPEIACGLKRGFSYFSHQFGESFSDTFEHKRQLLVAASPSSETADTHWYREDVDNFLVKEAIALGVDYQDQTEANLIGEPNETGAILRLNRLGIESEVTGALLVDASGPRGFLSRALFIPEVNLPNYPLTTTLFSHFEGVKRAEDVPDFANALDRETPFPPDDAALHHVFPGGWIWVLRFNNGITSAGVACKADLAKRFGFQNGESGWHLLLDQLPSVKAQFVDAKPVRRLDYSPQMSYRAERAYGPGWAMLPSAAGFVDPLFSTGIPLTLLGIERLSNLLLNIGDYENLRNGLEDYNNLTLEEIDWTATFIGGCYSSFDQFRTFQDYSMHYFAAASYSEMARRLPGSISVKRFLAADRAEFAASLRSGAELLRNRGDVDIELFGGAVGAGVDTINIAGLCDPLKQNWYGVNMQDVVDGAVKLGLNASTVIEIVNNAEWAEGCRVIS